MGNTFRRIGWIGAFLVIFTCHPCASAGNAVENPTSQPPKKWWEKAPRGKFPPALFGYQIINILGNPSDSDELYISQGFPVGGIRKITFGKRTLVFGVDEPPILGKYYRNPKTKVPTGVIVYERQ